MERYRSFSISLIIHLLHPSSQAPLVRLVKFGGLHILAPGFYKITLIGWRDCSATMLVINCSTVCVMS